MSKRKTFGEEVAAIAAELNLPKATVEAVLRTRYKLQVAAIMNGESVTVEGLFNIKTLRDMNTGKLSLRGGVSPALKAAVNDPTKKLRML